MLDNTVLKWFNIARSKNIPVSDDMIQTKAIQLFEELKIQDPTCTKEYKKEFDASNGWVRNFKRRFGLVSKLENGESRSVDLNVVEEARLSLKDLLSNYEIDDIYNTDELGLFYCLGPSRTLAAKDDEAKGCKKNKERITVLLTSNASGTVKIKVKYNIK